MLGKISRIVARPLSPHLQVYKLPVAALMSISHRISGLFLFLSSLCFSWLFALFALFADSRLASIAELFVFSRAGKLCCFVWTVMFLYHLSNGVRHVLWDMGFGLEKRFISFSGVLVFFAMLISLVTVLFIASFS